MILKVFLQNVHKNRILTDIILKTQKEFNIIFIQELPWSFIQAIPSLCYGMLWTLTFFFFFYLFFLILYFFSFEFLFLLLTMKRHVTLQSHGRSHDVMS